jgi:hypothetical protein
MAPRTVAQRFLIILCLLLIAASILPFSVSAAPLTVAPALPDLQSFRLSVQNGHGTVLRGVYANGLFAFPVLQQPTGNAGYVSTTVNTVTQFSLATQVGNIGLLAHDNLSGRYFPELAVGQMIQLVYGDGRVENFRVSHLYRFQAVSPSSVYSSFIDLDTKAKLSANTLFRKVYGGSRHVTFQTCITRDGNSSWGRLFVIADPQQPPSPVAIAQN